MARLLTGETRLFEFNQSKIFRRKKEHPQIFRRHRDVDFEILPNQN